MYFTDAAEDPVGIGSLGSGLNPSLPKSTMTLGRAGARVPYGVRAAVMGSSPNINSGGGGGGSGGALMPSDAIVFGGDIQNQPSQAATVPHSMRQVKPFLTFKSEFYVIEKTLMVTFLKAAV